jgi:NADP-dependent 3-hydroxy acid dehydrogenase YdfG
MILTNKVAIVTGASAGIGTAFSRALIKKGATVYGLARRADRLHDLKSELSDRFIPVVMDVTDRAGLFAWVTDTFNASNRPDIVVNNAGLGHFGGVDALSPDDWDTMLSVNLTGVFNLTHAIVPHLKDNPSVTHIVNIASVAGLLGNPNLSGYNATKFGLRGFSDALMKELRGFGIKVSCMYPGSIDTEFSTTSHPNMMQAPDVAKVLINLLEMPDNFLIDEIVMRPLNPKPPAA